MRMARYLYSELARAQHNVNTHVGGDFQHDYLDALTDWLPSGSGIDSGTKVDAERTHAEKLVLTFGYHHMDDSGYYDGWTEHTAVLTPSWDGEFNMRITGRDRNQVKDHLYETFDYQLRAECSVLYWQTLLGAECPSMKTRWIDQCRMVVDVTLPETDIHTRESLVNMSTEYTCPCGIYVHPSVINPSAIHIQDCVYAPNCVRTFGDDEQTKYSMWESARAYIVQWCARNYWEVGRKRTAEERARYDADMNARNGGADNE